MDKNRYKCSYENCDASYNKQWRLKVHILKHTGERPFLCPVENCDKTFTQPAHLKRHNVLVHEKSAEIICTVDNCNRIFNNKYSLKKHHVRCHVNPKLFKCGICSKEFKRRRFLQAHSFVHTGEAPHKCTQCPLGFLTNAELNKHMKNHSTYNCECGDIFDKWTKLCLHKRTDCELTKTKVNICDICNKHFKNQNTLGQHKKIHTDLDNRDLFICEYENCDRVYTHKKNLVYHVKVFHEKNVEDVSVFCEEPGCGLKLKNKKNLKQHIRIVHSGEKKPSLPRKPRKDKGISKVSMASKLTGVKISFQANVQVIEDTSKSEFELKQTEIVQN